jgi:hypothetical protein
MRTYVCNMREKSLLESLYVKFLCIVWLLVCILTVQALRDKTDNWKQLGATHQAQWVHKQVTTRHKETSRTKILTNIFHACYRHTCASKGHTIAAVSPTKNFNTWGWPYWPKHVVFLGTFKNFGSFESLKCECEELTSVCTQDGELIVIFVMFVRRLTKQNANYIFITFSLYVLRQVTARLKHSELNFCRYSTHLICYALDVHQLKHWLIYHRQRMKSILLSLRLLLLRRIYAMKELLSHRNSRC